MTLRLTVHRGTNQIGGSCIEIAHRDGARLILDAGRQLNAARDALGLLPATLDTIRPATILISHAHQDHWGILHEMPGDWPVWTGQMSERLIRLGYAMGGKPISQPISTWRYHAPFCIGPFTVTPYLTDHSAPDAAMLLIEANGQRIFYTGDFRTHGRKGRLVEKMMANPPSGIDVLITEGTNLGTGKPTVSETEIERRFGQLLDEVSGRVFVYWSAQNGDRTTSLFRAVKRRSTKFFVDLYTAEVMDLLAQGTKMPHVTPVFNELSLVVTRGQRRVRKKDVTINRATDALIERCIGSNQAISLRNLPQRCVVVIRDSMLRDLADAGITPCAQDAFVFSSWSGYAETISAKSFSLMKEAGARIEHIHTSGHASAADIRRFMTALSPRQIVPVHGENWDIPHEGFPPLLRLLDGEAHDLAIAGEATRTDSA